MPISEDTPLHASTNNAANEAAELPRAYREGRSRSSRHRSEQSGSGIRNKKSQRLILAVTLAVTLLVLLAVSVIAGIRIDSLTEDQQNAQAELFKTKQALAKTLPELQQARKELGTLIKGQFPHLRELAPDKVITLDTAYIKNIVFTLLQKNGKTVYEYRLVMENTSEYSIRPDARIFVFDHRGAQIGMGEVTDRTDMVPGESRSYSATVERFIEEEPRYFYIWTRSKGRPEFPVK